MMLGPGRAYCQHPGAVMSWSVLSSSPCSHLVSLHKGETIQRGKFLAAVRRGKGVPAGLARVLMCLWSILRLWPRGTKQPLTWGKNQFQNKSPVGNNVGTLRLGFPQLRVGLAELSPSHWAHHLVDLGISTVGIDFLF